MKGKARVEISVVRLDELPVLFGVIERLEIARLLDEEIARHANWIGALGIGGVVSGWLAFILSTADHRLNQVEDWVEQRREIYEACLKCEIRGLDFSDDRLANILDKLSQAEVWERFETGLNQQIIRVYELKTEFVRLDSTTISTYTAVNAEGLLQLGHSKDKRPEDAQLKIQLAILDPLGMPLATQVVAGNSADDPLYLPAIRAVQKSIGTGGKTYIGDVKMAALKTRASLAQSKDYYLCPLGELQLSEAQQKILIDEALRGKVKLSKIKRERRNLLNNEVLAREEIALGYGVTAMLSSIVNDQRVSWTERRLIIQSKAYAKAETAQLDKRLARAETQLHDLVVRRQGKRRLTVEQIRTVAQQLIVEQRVEGLLSATVSTTQTKRAIQRYKDAPARTQTHVTLSINIKLHPAAIKQAKQRMGWRIYATNHPKLTLSQIVLAYREQYRIEDGFSRLKGRPLGLAPMFLQFESRMTGLIHLLTIALRALTLIEFGVHRQLQMKRETLAGIYAGQKGRRTTRPSAELLLKAFENIDAVIGSVNGAPIAHLSPLTLTQSQILSLLGLDPHLYDNLLSRFNFRKSSKK